MSSGELSDGDLSASAEPIAGAVPSNKSSEKGGNNHGKTEDDDFEFADYAMQKKGGAGGGTGGGGAGRNIPGSSAGARAVKDQHFDEAVEVSEGEDESVASPNHSPKGGGGGQKKSSDIINNTRPSQPNNNNNNSKPMNADEESEGEEESDNEGGGGVGVVGEGAQPAKLYNPADYKSLQVSQEIQDLFDYIGRYKAQDIELETKLKPFIPDYIPAVGEIDNFLKIPPPDGTSDGLGLTVLDEPAAHQSDPTVLELQLRVVSKQSHSKPITVRSIDHADKNPKKILRWIANIDEVHRQKPPPTVNYSKIFPAIDDLMQAWNPEFESILKANQIPTQLSDIDLSIDQLTQLVCAILDIPTYNGKLIESLHVLFTLYSEFKNNPHFQH